jgi:hypothetical protein
MDDDGAWPAMAILGGGEIVEPTFWPGESEQNRYCDIDGRRPGGLIPCCGDCRVVCLRFTANA